jgi:hypothetical protein
MAPSQQAQSPFFRLPRELRDTIYEYYAHHDGGLIYDYASRKLRYADKTIQQQRIALRCSCQAAAVEMQDVTMRANDITFFTARSENDGDGSCYHRSRVGRFKRLVRDTCRMKMHILHHIADCVTLTVVDQVVLRFPSIARYYRNAFAAIKKGSDEHTNIVIGFGFEMSAVFCEALDYTLELASVMQPEFDRLADEAARTSVSEGGRMPPFVPGSHANVLAWNPPWWSIPTESDLVLEKSLTSPMQIGPFSSEWDSRIAGSLAPIASFYSATAVAISFLRSLTINQLGRLQGKIVIKEDKKGAMYPQSHVRGLLYYCRANPRLRIEMHASLWTNLLPPTILQPHSPPSVTWVDTLELLGIFADFIEELALFSNSGLPANALVVILEGQHEATLVAWEQLKLAASLQEGLAKSTHIKQHGEASLNGFILRLESGDTMPNHEYLTLNPESWRLVNEGDSLERFHLPCDLPPSFHVEMRRIVESRSIIRFDGDPGPLWSQATIEERRHWTPHQFCQEWGNKVMMGDSHVPPEVLTAIRDRHKRYE